MNATQGAAALRPAEEQGWWARLGGHASSAASWVSEQASDAGEWVGQTASDAADWAGETYDDAADWVGETYDDAADWVGETYDDTAEWVGETYDDVKDAAYQAWSAASNTDFTWEDGVITVATDLDEVLPILPASVRSQLRLDGAAAENRIRAALDTRSRTVTITSADLAVRALSHPQLSTGPVHLQGVTVVLSNYGGALPFLIGDFSFLGYESSADPEETAVRTHLTHATASAVAWTGPGGPVFVDHMDLSEVAASIENTEAGLGDVSLAIRTGIVDGLRARGVSASHLQVLDADAFVDLQSGDGKLSASAVRGHGLQQGGRTIETAEVTDLAAAGSRVGTGEARGVVSTGTLGMTGYDSERMAVESARMTGASADLNVAEGSLYGRVEQANLIGARTGWVDVADGQLDGATVSGRLSDDDTAHRLDLHVEGLRADGVGYAPRESDPKTGSPHPVEWSLGVDRMDGSALTTSRLTAARASGSQLYAEGRMAGAASTYEGRAQALEIDGLQHEFVQANALRAREASLVGEAGSTRLSAAEASVAGLRSESVAAGRIAGHGGHMEVTNTGIAGGFAEAQASDLLLDGRVGIEQATIDGLAARRNTESATIALDRAEMRGMSDAPSGASLEHLVAESGQVVMSEGSAVGSLESARATSLSAGDVRFDAADVSSATYRRGRDGHHGTAETLDVRGAGVGTDFSAETLHAAQTDVSTADGLWTFGAAALGGDAVAYDDVTAGRLDTQAVDGSLAEDRFDLEVGRADLATVRVGGAEATADRVSADDLTVRQRGSDWRVGADAADATQVRVGDDTSAASAGLRETEVAWGDQGMSATAGSASAQRLRMGSNSVGGASATGASVTVHDGVVAARADEAQASNLVARTGGTTVQAASLSARGAGLQVDDHTHVQADHAVATGVRHRQEASPGQSGAASSSEVDTSSLIRSAAARIDDADIQGSAPLIAGEHGPVRVRPGTTASGRASIRDGRFVPGQTGATFSRGLSGPLWTSVHGVYVDDRQRLRADVRGWGDQDLTETFNNAMGVPGKSLPATSDLGRYAAPASTSTEETSNPVDLSGHAMSGQASFTAGTIDAGDFGSVTLGRAGRGENTVRVRSTGQEGLTANADRVVLDGIDARGANVRAGATSASDARVQVLPDGTVISSADRVEMSDFRGHD